VGFLAAQWFARQSGLAVTQQAIMWRASWSCQDDTGWLPRSNAWLAERCALSERSLERHLPQLRKLEFLVKGDGGFRLPRFVADHRQIGGKNRQFVRQNVRQIGGAQEEGFSGNIGKKILIPSSSRESGTDGDGAQIRAIAVRYGVTEDVAAAALYTGEVRHFASGAVDPIRSVEFFAEVVADLQRQSAQGGRINGEYLAYLRSKAAKARKAWCKAALVD